VSDSLPLDSLADRQTSMAAPVSVAVLGVGLVGSAFLRQLAALQSSAPAGIATIALVHAQTSRRGTPIPPSSSSLTSLQPTHLSLTGPALTHEALIAHLTAVSGTGGGKKVVVDNTSSEEVARWYPALLRAGISVITPNKKAFSGPLNLYTDILSASASGGPGVRALHEATVGAGLPIIQTLNDLVQTGDTVSRIEGVLSGTLSYIFNEFSPASPGSSSEKPKTFSSIVSQARAAGYTEPHPADDLSGTDVARKLTILSRLIPQLSSALPDGYASVSIASLVPKELEGVDTGDEFVRRLEEFDGYFEGLRKEADAEGSVLRYVGVVDVEKGSVRAALEK